MLLYFIICTKKILGIGLHSNSNSNSNTMRRDYYRGSQDSLAMRGKFFITLKNKSKKKTLILIKTVALHGI